MMAKQKQLVKRPHHDNMVTAAANPQADLLKRPLVVWTQDLRSINYI